MVRWCRGRCEGGAGSDGSGGEGECYVLGMMCCDGNGVV